jgi:tetratricopeptide (TPR) repeat protein
MKASPIIEDFSVSKKSAFGRLSILSTVILVGLCSIVFGANRIECRLQPPSGYELPESIQVNLKMVSGGLVDSAAPQGNGRFTFNGLKSGKYLVTVDADGFIPIQETVEIPSGYIHNTVNLIVRLTPKPDLSERLSGEKTVILQSLKVPKNAKDELEKAEKEAAKGNLKNAIRHADKAVEIYPEYFTALNNLAVYYHRTGKNDKAVKHLRKALSLNPDAVEANSNLGRILLEMKRSDDAIPYLARASELSPTSSEIQFQLARAFILSHQFPKSLKPLRRSLELEPPIEYARFLLAHVLFETGDLSGAVEQLALYIKTGPKNRRELEKRLTEWKSILESNG